MIQSLLSNLAIILLLHLTMTFIMGQRKKIRPSILKPLIIVIQAGAVISMFYLPIYLTEDYFVDMRLIPLTFLAYFQGWIAIPTLLIASLWRYCMGGDGMVPGIFFGMVLPTLIALAFHPRSKLQKQYLEKIFIILLSWFVSDFPIIFIIPNGLEIFKETELVRASSIIVTAVILYSYIVKDRQLRILNSHLEKMADEDPLTKLVNKRKFYELLEEKLKILKPKHFIAMLDIDHFKKVNDTYGHLFGDKVLVGVADILRKYECKNMVVGRFGGEEFIIYFGETDFMTTKNVLEAIRKDIKNTTFMYKESIPVNITVSIGLSELEEIENVIQSIYLADQNLYRAKQSGRDRLVYSP